MSDHFVVSRRVRDWMENWRADRARVVRPTVTDEYLTEATVQLGQPRWRTAILRGAQEEEPPVRQIPTYVSNVVVADGSKHKPCPCGGDHRVDEALARGCDWFKRTTSGPRDEDLLVKIEYDGGWRARPLTPVELEHFRTTGVSSSYISASSLRATSDRFYEYAQLLNSEQVRRAPTWMTEELRPAT